MVHVLSTVCKTAGSHEIVQRSFISTCLGFGPAASLTPHSCMQSGSTTVSSEHAPRLLRHTMVTLAASRIGKSRTCACQHSSLYFSCSWEGVMRDALRHPAPRTLRMPRAVFAPCQG
jgi:hypothetical protein